MQAGQGRPSSAQVSSCSSSSSSSEISMLLSFDSNVVAGAGGAASEALINFDRLGTNICSGTFGKIKVG